MTSQRTNLASSLTLALAGLLLAACGSGTTAAGAGTTTTGAAATGPALTSGQQGTQAGSGACGTSGVKVSTASELRSALAGAQPGGRILLAPGMYSSHFKVTVSGTPSAPITLCGPRAAVINGGGISSGYTFYLDGASWWRVEGFTVEGGQKGVVTDRSSHDLIYGLYVHGIGDEAIHLRDFSSYDTVSHDVVRSTGLNRSFFGEGIYVGSANHNWCRYSGCQPDASNHDVIIGNNVADTTAENADIKEGTSFGTIIGNHFDGTGMDPASATSWVNVKGNNWTVTGNTGIGSIQDGFSVHQVYPGWGMGTVFKANVATVNGPGYGFYVQSSRLMTVVSCNNKVSGAQSGFSNHPCTPA